MANKVSESTAKALVLAYEDRLGSWDVGSGTLGALKKKGLVAEISADARYVSGRRYGLTPAGLEFWRNTKF